MKPDTVHSQRTNKGGDDSSSSFPPTFQIAVRKPTMPRYKLTYFPIRGRAEYIRIVFAVGGVEFENVRVNPEEWFTTLKQCECRRNSFVFFPSRFHVSKKTGSQ